MRVLDIGCGAGDVSMLLAEVVGEAGSVIAFDRESARDRNSEGQSAGGRTSTD